MKNCETFIFNGDANELMDIILSWKAECNLESFGLDENVFTMRNSLQGMIDTPNQFLLIAY